MRAILFLFLCLIGVQPLRGTTLLRYDLEALTRQAETILVGTCESMETKLVRGQAYTRTPAVSG
jgi:hypothetical protein